MRGALGLPPLMPIPAPHPAPAMPHHWTWQVCTGLRQSPLGLETDLLRFWRNEPGFPLLTSLLIRFRRQRAGRPGCSAGAAFPAPRSLCTRGAVWLCRVGKCLWPPVRSHAGVRTRVSTHPPSCWCLCASACKCVCAGFWRSLQTKPAGPLPSSCPVPSRLPL